MELELGFKISKTLDEFSSADLRISKGQGGPVFISRETDTMFVLNAYLKGYKKEHIQIKVNEDATRITIRGERPVQEMVMVKWQMHNKEAEIRGFRKAFNIPEGVNLDKIKARFNEDGSVLKISMPKLVKGICGLKIKEINEEEEPLQNHNLKNKKKRIQEINGDIVSETSPSKEEEKVEQVVEEAKNIVSEKSPPKATDNQGLESDNLIEKSTEYQEQEGKNIVEQQANEEQDEGEDGVKEKSNDDEQQGSEEIQSNERVPKFCVPMIAGTAFITALIVFVIHMIRARK